ncbi:RDD family protein [Candidatus Solincola sp.]|nr:RDD family protein [Actinomycetota bacterium]
MKACPNCGLLNTEGANFCSGCGYRLSDVMPPGTTHPAFQVAEGAYPRYAGFWIRFAAAIVDGLVLSVAFLPVNLLFWAVNENIHFWGSWDFSRGVSSGLLFLFNVIRTLIGWAYYTYLTGRYGATLGKKLLGLRVVGEDLQPVTYGTAVVREIPGKLLSALACMLGYIWAGFDGRKQAWHDKIARTLVIYG